MPVAIADAAEPLAVDASEECVVVDCERRPIVRARLRTEATNHEWRDVPMCVWHRMAAGTMNGYLFDGDGNLLPEYTPTMIDGLLCFVEGSLR